jgi:hypothetical protein
MLHGEGISVPALEEGSPIVGFYVWRHADAETATDAGRKAVASLESEIANGPARGAEIHVEQAERAQWWAGRIRRPGFIFYQASLGDDEPTDCPLRAGTDAVQVGGQRTAG